MDGMILDTFEDSYNCVNRVLEEFGIAAYQEDYRNIHYPSFRKYLNENNAGKDTPVYPRYIEMFRNDPLKNTKAFEGIIPVLETLQKKKVTLAICSNREEKMIRELARRFFKDIDFKYISGYRQGVPDKPNPYRINEIIDAENLSPEEVVYFGDKDADVKVARNAGIDLILVTYGQGSSEDYTNPYPLRVIDKAEEILELVEEGIIPIE
jgi:phosphoglycolate phosphatase